MTVRILRGLEKKKIINEEGETQEWVRGLRRLGERKLPLWGTRIYSIENMEGGPWNILSGYSLLLAGCPFLVEVFKMLSMKETERRWEGERGTR